MARKSNNDSEDVHIRKLKTIIKNREKTIKKLKSEIKTMELAWKKTEIYLEEVTEGRPLSKVINTVSDDNPLQKHGQGCPKCMSKFTLKTIVYSKFHILVCECGYKEKINEEKN